MPYTEAQKKATMKYIKAAYDRIELKVPKGKKAIIQDYASQHGESVNSFINRLIDKAIEKKM